VSWLRANKTIIGIWLLFVGGYAVVSLLLPYGPRLNAFGDMAQCAVLLFTNAGLLLNAGSADWRRNAFWLLTATGCGLWLAANLLWTYVEVVLRQPVPDPFLGDVIFFLHTVPLIAALAVRPHRTEPDRNLRVGNLDLLLLAGWWIYLYSLVVLPWQYVHPNESLYSVSYDRLYCCENVILLVALLYLGITVRGAWRVVYLNLFGAGCCYALASVAINAGIDRGTYHTGSFYDLGLMAAFVWYGTTGIIARRLCPPARAVPSEPAPDKLPSENPWPARLAIAAALSLPGFGAWSELEHGAPPAVTRFRLLLTLGTIIAFTSLVFRRQSLMDRDRMCLLRSAQESFVNLKRIQSQFVQSEKLASLGQLVAAAAHEINNPLTAILGFSDVLLQDTATPEASRKIAETIRDQARRTRDLVGKLISFAQPPPAQRSLLDINSIVSNALELRRVDLLGRNIRLDLDTRGNLPGVNGDANQLLQVFFNLISNAVDALEEMGGGTLAVRTRRELSNIVIEFSDTGPGVREPHLVFDPFYTTKPPGKGTGLGLSICYSLIKEHGGNISCHNRPSGGATFRIELPAVLALFPSAETTKSQSAVSTRMW
jgi:signal transduction histidine kinase